MHIYNFSAGPAILPTEVHEQIASACVNYNHMGISILGLGHRTKEFSTIFKECRELLTELLDIPSNYSILFLTGGATTQFYQVPLNLLKSKAAYIDTGIWSQKAIAAAQKIGKVEIVATGNTNQYRKIPHQIIIPKDVDYLHYTSNNTIYGTEFEEEIKTKIPLVSDMSSDILSKPIDIKKYALIYAGAQKNLSMAGVTLVIVNNDLLGKVEREIPDMLNYERHILADGILNTLPVLPIYGALLMLRWVKAHGGVQSMRQQAILKSNKLYKVLDSSTIFMPAVTEIKSRSKMNICFYFRKPSKELESEFLDFALQRGIYGIKGHRLAGGFRVSNYNAMPMQGIEAFIEMIKDFEFKIAHGS